MKTTRKMAKRRPRITNEFYAEINNNIRATDEISFKLLNIVPIMSGIGAAVLTVLEKSQLLLGYSDFIVVFFSLFGILITFGLFKWELWNIYKCRYLIKKAAEFEEASINNEQATKRKIQWDGWEEDWKNQTIEMYSLFEGLWGKTRSEKLIYVVAIAAWFIPLAALLNKSFFFNTIGKMVNDAAFSNYPRFQ